MATRPDDHQATAVQMRQAAATVFSRWEALVRANVTYAERLKQPILLDTLPLLYESIADKIKVIGSDVEIVYSTVAQEHGGERARFTRYEAESIIHEYQLLRRAIVDVLRENDITLSPVELNVLNAEIDNAIRESVTGFIAIQSIQREQFFAALTHDLRTPLSTASMATDMIARCKDLADAKHLASVAARHHAELDTMITDMLDVMVQVPSQQALDVTSFDVRAVIEEVVASAKLASQRTIILSGPNAVGYWDLTAIRRSVENLLSNAIKYSFPKTDILISIKQYGARVALLVSNTGPMVPVEDSETIFHLFRRSSNAGTTTGWGIGLPYVRSVAERHGGSVSVESEGDQTTFIFDVLLDARSISDPHLTEAPPR